MTKPTAGKTPTKRVAKPKANPEEKPQDNIEQPVTSQQSNFDYTKESIEKRYQPLKLLSEKLISDTTGYTSDIMSKSQREEALNIKNKLSKEIEKVIIIQKTISDPLTDLVIHNDRLSNEIVDSINRAIFQVQSAVEKYDEQIRVEEERLTKISNNLKELESVFMAKLNSYTLPQLSKYKDEILKWNPSESFYQEYLEDARKFKDTAVRMIDEKMIKLKSQPDNFLQEMNQPTSLYERQQKIKHETTKSLIKNIIKRHVQESDLETLSERIIAYYGGPDRALSHASEFVIGVKSNRYF